MYKSPRPRVAISLILSSFSGRSVVLDKGCRRKQSGAKTRRYSDNYGLYERQDCCSISKDRCQSLDVEQGYVCYSSLVTQLTESVWNRNMAITALNIEAECYRDQVCGGW